MIDIKVSKYLCPTTTWETPVGLEGLRLMGIGCAIKEAYWMEKEGWTVEKVSEATAEDLVKYSGHLMRSSWWINCSRRLLNAD